MYSSALILFLALTTAQAEDGTRFLQMPAVNETHLAFVFGGDIWLAEQDGTHPRRLTSGPGYESRPAFSPDGTHLAFTGEYEGNLDVYLIPIRGGQPVRLTWHPGDDFVRGFSTDGKHVLFSSSREDYSRRSMNKLFTVPVTGGLPTPLPLPFADKGDYRDDGRLLAYTPYPEAFLQWKHYRGGRTGRIWLYDSASGKTDQVPQVSGNCNDSDPAWLDGKLYFRSDREGTFNLYRYEPKGELKQITDHNDYGVMDVAAGGGVVVYEQAGYLHRYLPEKGVSERLSLVLPYDWSQTMPRYDKASGFVRSGTLSPDGKRALLEIRGEIFSVPASKGDARNLTQTPGAHERAPIWSPTGNRVVWLAERDDRYQLHIEDLRNGEVTTRPLEGTGFYRGLKMSPDGTKLTYMDNGLNLYWMDLDSGLNKKIAQESEYGPGIEIPHAWSTDTRWVAYAIREHGLLQTVFLYNLETGKHHRVSDGLSDVSEPVFDASGKYLYFISSTDAGPVQDWFSQSNQDMQRSDNIYLMVLSASEPNPLGHQNDEADLGTEENKSGTDDGVVHIDLEGIANRIVVLPTKPGVHSNLRAAGHRKIAFLHGKMGADHDPDLYRFDLDAREMEPIGGRADDFEISANGNHLLVHQNGSYYVMDVARGTEKKGKIDLDNIQVKVDPRQEWRQMLREAWRINRDYFYATNYHGSDWTKVWQKYEVFLDHIAVRQDIHRLIRWMGSELAVGHHYVYGGSDPNQPEPVPGGLLGANLRPDGEFYRIGRIFRAINWNADVTSPLDEPGVEVVQGQYLLGVGDHRLQPHENPYRYLEHRAGETISLTVADDTRGRNERTVRVTPIADERRLRHLAWVEDNIRYVDERTNGRVAYVHVPDTGSGGHQFFKRYFYPQSHKEAVIVDERFNSGGLLPDYIISHLQRSRLVYWRTRYGKDLSTPKVAIDGPKAMLINNMSSSGGDMLPWMFRKFQLGKLVGTRTWGGLVGILGFPVLMDGTTVTAPDLAIWTEEDGWIVENEGVAPDIYVEMWPADTVDGRDPQLDAAIDWILGELPAKKPAAPVSPPLPIKNH